MRLLVITLLLSSPMYLRAPNFDDIQLHEELAKFDNAIKYITSNNDKRELERKRRMVRLRNW